MISESSRRYASNTTIFGYVTLLAAEIPTVALKFGPGGGDDVLRYLRQYSDVDGAASNGINTQHRIDRCQRNKTPNMRSLFAKQSSHIAVQGERLGSVGLPGTPRTRRERAGKRIGE